MWRHLFEIAKSNTDMRLAAMQIIRFAMSNLRFAHALRAHLCEDMCTAGDMIWEIDQGKDGKPFRCALPVYAEAGWPMNKILQQAFVDAHGAEVCKTHLLLEMRITAGNTLSVSPAKATFSRFTDLLRGVMQLAPLSLPDEDVARMSTYSARRLFPTVADVLQLDVNERNSLGNWKDNTSVRELMHVRYSAFRLQACGDVKRICVRALSHTAKHAQHSSIMRVSGARPHLPHIKKEIFTSHWGKGSEPLPPLEAFDENKEPSPPTPKRVRSGV